MDKKATGARIASLLREKGITQRELADRIGATEGAVSKYVNGEREPRAEMLANIATVLGTTSEALLGMDNSTETSFGAVKALCAREAPNMTQEQRDELIVTILRATRKETI